MKQSDKTKLKRLAKVAAVSLLVRLFFYFFTSIKGLIIDVLWIPIFFFLLAIPFYSIEYLLDKLKERMGNSFCLLGFKQLATTSLPTRSGISR